MKILFVQPTGDKQGHYGIYTTHVCQELSRQGEEVILFTNKIHTKKYISEKPLFKIFEFKKGKYSFGRFDQLRKKVPLIYVYGYLRGSFVAIREMIKFIRKNKIDLIFVMDTEYAILSFLIRFFGKKLPPLVLMVQAANFSFKKFSGHFLFKIYKVFQRKIFRTAIARRKIKGFVVLGEFHKEELRKQLGLGSDFPIKVIYDGANPPKKFLNKTSSRKKLDINYDKFIFLFFGMLRKDKGIECLLKAIALLRKEEFKLIIAGSLFEYKKKEIERLISELKIKDKVILRLEYIDDKMVPFYFFSSDVVVFPYKKNYTGGSGPLLKEAAIYKKPVIASNVSEMGRLVEKYQMGFTFKSEDASNLANRMKRFLSLPEKKREILANNSSSAANTWKKMAKEYSRFFKTILNETD